MITSVSALPVFPGAEGFGTDTVAGRGGTVYNVTTLASSGSGSLRECIDASGPRVCVFEVSGTIETSGDLNVINPYITIAGQTAPSPGIQIKGGGFRIAGGHNVLIQHLRIRPGDDPIGPEPDWRRAMSMSGTETNPPHHVVIDHCTLQWGIDANANIWAQNAHHITYSNNIIAECLNYSTHSEGWHSMTLNIDHSGGGGHRNISIIKNYLAHGGGRNPKIGGNTYVQLVNNVMYNMRNYHIMLTDSRAHGPHKTSIVGNIGIEGLNSRFGTGYTTTIMATVSDGTRVYEEDSMCTNYPDCTRVDRPAGVTFITSPEIWSPVTVLQTANNEARDYVLANAGARPAERDQAEIRVTQDAVDGTGKLKDCVDSNPIYYPTGTARGGSSNTIIVEPHPHSALYWAPRGWISREIEITSGTGSSQKRIITAFNTDTSTATVSPNWNTAPDTTSRYRRIIDCSISNAGGWPVYAENYRPLTIPNNPNGDDDGDGYTNLEEWLHGYSVAVEGGSIPSCTSHSYSSCNNGDVYWYDSCNVREDIRYECGTQQCVNGACVVIPPQSQSYTALRTDLSPVIDGDCSEYNGANQIQIVPAEGGNIGTYKLLWDDNALYICGDVTDTQLNADYTTRDLEVWRDDSLEVVFDIQNNKGVTTDSNDYKFYVSLLNTQTDSNDQNRAWSTTYASDVTTSGTINSNSNTDIGYAAEMRVRWSDWGITNPNAGDVWGFDLKLNDKDAADKYSGTWSNTDGDTFNNPDGWGEITFSAQEASSIEGDINGDGKVNIYDLIMVAIDFGKTSSYQQRADTDSNNIIDIFDVVFVASRFT